MPRPDKSYKFITVLNLRKAITAVERAGALLVFPADNRPEPASLWSHFFPDEKMRWEWDDNGDGRVFKMWELRSHLTESRRVVYTKWWQGRATVFSRPLFVALLAALRGSSDPRLGLGREARALLEVLELDSPLSTKALRRASDFVGRDREAEYNRGLKELWSRLLIVAFGEVDDGSFPSLAVGSTRLLLEDLWTEAMEMPPETGEAYLVDRLSAGSPFFRHYVLTKRQKERTLALALQPAPPPSYVHR